MRRTILVLAAVALMLAMAGAPAGAHPPGYPEWDTYCDMNHDTSDGLEVHTTQVASFKPGWTIEPAPLPAPAVWFGGHVEVYVNGSGTPDPSLARDIYPPSGMVGRLTTCTQEATYARGSGDTWRIVWDPAYAFSPPPTIP
jgi:hypothetical protein